MAHSLNEETPPEEVAPPPAAEVEEPPAPVLALSEVQASIEALLYASPEPLSIRDLKKALPEAGDRIREALDLLRELYQRDGRGLQLVEVAGGFQITTRPEYHEVISRILEGPRPARLSLQALETLAVIAYRQPITVPEIMDLRGVRSAGVVRTLLERKLVRIVGRKNVVGRPLLYGTTREFLLRFGLKDVKDLPQLKDMSEVFGDEVAQQLELLEEIPGAPEQTLPAPEPEEGGPAEP
jgi:segregation and condensation protein B